MWINLLIFAFLLVASTALVARVGRHTTRRQIVVRSYGMVAIYAALIAGVVIPSEWSRISARLTDSSWLLIVAALIIVGGVVIFASSFMIQSALKSYALKHRL